MSLSEFQIISHYFAATGLGFPRDGVRLGIGDDAAIVEFDSDVPVSMSMDILIEGVHFPNQTDGFNTATRALAVNLSDLAAMAAEPLCFTLGLSLPAIDEAWVEGFAAGLSQLAKRYNCPLVGGDLTRSPENTPITIAIQVHGSHQKNAPVRRSGAKPGDGVFVTGALGDGALALASLGLSSHLGVGSSVGADELPDDDRRYFEEAYFQPQPRLDFALQAATLMSACIDISDGLAGDLGHILHASGVGADINLDEIPYSLAALMNTEADIRRKAALYGGDDYELCFTATADGADRLREIADRECLALHQIGVITNSLELRLLNHEGLEVTMEGQAYQHFSGEAK